MKLLTDILISNMISYQRYQMQQEQELIRDQEHVLVLFVKLITRH
ncbi:N-terminal cleavage protein [Escherichia coli]|nr:prepilin-type N-cleavage/methylation domain protein [Escherichia coli BCE019_MS-13]ENA30980.1 prepilin-type N-cleavage/methylation domain protein [Escherichia coli BCE007_MS-11]ENA52405.1 prepilin-type N-cleavage/methylation domain protein [Escherichia coli 2729250]ENA85055.1 prepilin-type N-cleavage/methylation domain protein [Escherichia coli 2730450]ENB27846.1 prepilin-type N-cleavage/methylation domain protein [Escherichia coli BCE030_MS-09]ENB35449.1 prepilin-type N-cleavage/methylatio